MTQPSFFALPEVTCLGDIAALTGAKLQDGVDPKRPVRAAAPLNVAGPDAISFLDNTRYLPDLQATRAAACFVASRYADRVPASVASLVTPDPYRAFASALAALFPTALRPQPMFGGRGIAPGAMIHADARLEAGVTVDPGVVIGPGVEIGSGSVICAGAVIGPGCRIGRDCAVGPGASLQHALLGNRVIIHAGVRIGQDGFGFAMGPKGHLKVPQIGRVIIQDDVEIGANSCIDRGAIRDTVIGEGTKIDNLVQIAHNVTIGRHCVIVAQVGISGSATLEDFVALGGQCGVIGHVTVGMGAQIAATSNVASDVPAGARWGGTPAKPVKDWFREVTLISQLAKRKSIANPSDQAN